MLGRTRRIHFVGIGGIGMSGIAELLANLGYAVSGSDAKRSDVTARLESACGVTVFEGHVAGNVGDADVVVYSSAVKRTNPEIAEALRRAIPVIPRAEMLAELMRLRFSIAVAGSHGKTTTTSMVALVLERAGLDPTAVIGGRLSAFGSNARLGRGNYMVAEADESDRSFLMLLPSIAVMTNIDHEHMDTYGSFEELQRAFVDFANKVPFYGSVVVCVDDPHVRAVLPSITRRVVTYGLDEAASGGEAPAIGGRGVQLGSFGGTCTVVRRAGGEETVLGTLELAVPGRHNLQNALAAVAVATELGIDFARVAATLREFHGAERRFERVGEANGVLIVDDYGHHPTEIAAVLSAARVTLGRRLLVAFQPHRYTRTQHLMKEFGPAFADADEVVLTDIYAASEEPIAGVTVEALAESVARASGRPVRIVKRIDQLADDLAASARPGDAVFTLGAGSIASVPKKLLAALRAREAKPAPPEEEAGR
ncbi:MAG TPA: UDP-N-acetylmuramate--L-alanine ligase [Vicinamibacterales bacterium]|nr:UDP-N-acetylmuramate--L-alanine ligase [Vicinamibacterales bacterium]